MKKLFLFGCFLALVSLIYAEIYSLDLIIYRNDSAELVSIAIKDGSEGPFPFSLHNNYYFKIIGKDNQLLFEKPFTLNFVVHPEPYENSPAPSEILLNKSEDFWHLPYFQDASAIQLFHEDKKIWEYDVEYLNPQIPSRPSATPAQQPGSGDSTGSIILSIVAIVVVIVILPYFLLRKKAN